MSIIHKFIVLCFNITVVSPVIYRKLASPGMRPRGDPRNWLMGVLECLHEWAGLAVILAVILGFIYVGGSVSVVETRPLYGVEGWPRIRVLSTLDEC